MAKVGSMFWHGEELFCMWAPGKVMLGLLQKQPCDEGIICWVRDEVNDALLQMFHRGTLSVSLRCAKVLLVVVQAGETLQTRMSLICWVLIIWAVWRGCRKDLLFLRASEGLVHPLPSQGANSSSGTSSSVLEGEQPVLAVSSVRCVGCGNTVMFLLQLGVIQKDWD